MRRWAVLVGMVLAVALVVLLPPSNGPALANGAVPACAFDIDSNPNTFTHIQTYEARHWKNVYATSMELAGFNQLLPDVADFDLPPLETGPRSAGSSTLVDPYIPPTLLKAIAWIESGWAQASYQPPVEYGDIGPVLISSSCAYGIMQVLSGMENTTGAPNLEQAMIGGHYGFNIARGARILAEKWNYAPAARPLVGTRDPHVVEDWYYAVWSYHGFADVNHPLNHPYPREPYRCDGTQPRSNYPYQELVFGCMANPPVVGGVRLWDPQPVTLPNLSHPAFSRSAWVACRGGFNCAGMDIPTPKPTHADPTGSPGDRGRVLGAPQLAVSPTTISLAAVPGGQSSTASITLSNAGSGPFVWRLTPSKSWLKLSRIEGVSLGADHGPRSQTITVHADARRLPPGTYGAQITVESLYASGAPRKLSVTLHVGEQAYWLAAEDGGIFAFGVGGFHGSAGDLPLNQPIVGMAATPSGNGYWLVASDGGIFTYGDAAFFGSAGNISLNQPIVGMATTPSGNGYWLVASDGGIFAFGDASFHGSAGDIVLNQPIVGMAATPSGNGYRLVASDGGIFTYGTARFRGSAGDIALNQPIVGMATTPSGKGYWLVASDGGIFTYGDAAFRGSTGNISLNQPIVGMAATPSGDGYWLVASDGGIFTRGDAEFHGSMGNTPLNQPIVGMAAR